MSIVRVSELSAAASITSGSLFLMSSGDTNPRTSTYVTAEQFLNQSNLRHNGAFFSTNTFIGGTEQVFTYNNTINNFGVTLQNNSQIVVSQPGIYNIQFSAQLTTSTGTAQDIYIWLKKNGTDVPTTNTRLTLGNKNSYIVAAWNFIDVATIGGTYYELTWWSTSNNVTCPYISNPSHGPAIPSIIVTIVQA